MRHEPEALPRPMLIEALRSLWGLDVKTLDYAPLGFGSHHWTATCRDGSRRFLTADHLPHLSTQDGDSIGEHFAGLRAAFKTARALRAGGLEFVLAPEPSLAGATNVLVAGEWSLAVFPFVEGEAMGPGTWRENPSAAEASHLLGRLHRAKPPAGLMRWSNVIPHRNELETALLDLDRQWRFGPFGEPARALLAAHRHSLQSQLAAYDRLAEAVMKMPEPWVVTHGEPQSANFLRSESGDILLIDWDTVRLAPRERDIELGEGEAYEAYREAAHAPPPRAEAMELFRLRWSLQDICVYVLLFRHEHGESEDEVESWRHLNSELERLSGW